MRRLLPCLLTAILADFGAYAQPCPSILNCPQGTQQYCDQTANDSLFWNAPDFTWSPTLLQPDLHEGSVDLNIKVLRCAGGGPVNVSYTLYMDLDNDNLEETVVESSALPPPGTVMANNAFNPGFTGGDTVRFDQRPVADSLKYHFDLQVTSLGDTVYAHLSWNTAANPDEFIISRLPEGKHRIVWTVIQNGTTKTCQNSFRVKDCLPPLVNCNGGLMIALDASGIAGLNLAAVLQSAEDLITPADQLQFSLRKAGTGSGFPVGPGGSPVLDLSYNCDEAGPHTVELWAKDRAGNSAFCPADLTVADNPVACAPPLPVICTKAVWGNHETIQQVGFDIVWVLADSTIVKNALPLTPDGCAQLNTVPSTATFTIVPHKNTNPLNGVSTYDLVQISRHILAIQPFDTPWKTLAADINRNGSVTTIDIIELRKLLLGVNDHFINNTSWRFFYEDCQFPSNPFSILCPPLTLTTMPLANYEPYYQFNGIKVGDVSTNADPDSLDAGPEDRSTATLLLPDRWLEAGETVDIPVQAPDLAAWTGFQLALQFEAQQLALEAVIPGHLPAMDEDVFGRPAPDILTASWFLPEPQWLVPGERLFSLRLRALRPVDLKKALHLLPERLKPEAYFDADARRLALRFGSSTAVLQSTTIFPPQPNPGAGDVQIPLYLSQGEQVALTLTDLSGKPVYSGTASMAAGPGALNIPAAVFKQTGLYLWRLQAGTSVQAGRLVRI